MGKLFLASLPGTLASSGMDGSYLLPLFHDVRRDELAAERERITTLGDRNPGLRKLREWVAARSRAGDALILAGKSLGAVRICLDVVKRDWQGYAFERVGLLTVDPWGRRYGWHRPWGKGSIPLPRGLLERGDGEGGSGFRGFNVVQRNQGLMGATVAGIETTVIDDPEARHGNIVFHPVVRARLVTLMTWALG